MRNQQKNTFQRIILGAGVLLLFAMNLSALVFLNGSNMGYGKSGEENTSGDRETIKTYIIEGAGYYLNSYSEFLLVLNRLELAEKNGLMYNEIQMILDRAISMMEDAREVYTSLKSEAFSTPYDPIVIDKLLDFDYDKFQKKNDLVEPIFDQVKYHLEQGEISEIYARVLLDVEEILRVALLIREKIILEEFPENSAIWNLDETLSISLRFGQYVARVFHEI